MPFNFTGIDKGSGCQDPSSRRTPRVTMAWMWRVASKRRAKCLDDRDHARPGVVHVDVDGGGHHLVNGFVGESCELSQKLSMIVGKNFVLEETGGDTRTLCSRLRHGYGGADRTTKSPRPLQEKANEKNGGAPRGNDA